MSSFKRVSPFDSQRTLKTLATLSMPPDAISRNRCARRTDEWGPVEEHDFLNQSLGKISRLPSSRPREPPNSLGHNDTASMLFRRYRAGKDCSPAVRLSKLNARRHVSPWSADRPIDHDIESLPPVDILCTVLQGLIRASPPTVPLVDDVHDKSKALESHSADAKT